MKARGPGEGMVRQRRDGTWEGRLRVDAGGRVSVYGRSKREVQIKLMDLRRERDRGGNVATSRMTMTIFLDRWLVDVVQPSVRPRSFRRYVQLVRPIKERLGTVPLIKLDPGQVAAFLASLPTPAQAHHVRTALRAALNVAVRWRVITYNAAALTDAPRVPIYRPVVLDPAQVSTFLKAIETERLRALYVMAVTTGMRQGELLGLRWADLDLTAGTVSVQHALDHGELVDVKTERSHRVIPLTRMAVESLVAHREQQRVGSLRGLVFTREDGSPCVGIHVTRHFQLLLRRAGLPQMRFHDLRGSTATFLAALGVPPRVVMEILGHSNIMTTLQVYTQAGMPAMREAMDKLDGWYHQNTTSESVDSSKPMSTRTNSNRIQGEAETGGSIL